jgi:hypothetical protein
VNTFRDQLGTIDFMQLLECNDICVVFQGFVSAVSNMRSFVPAIYDVTLAIPKSSPPPTMLNLFKGKSSVVSLQSN